jgi:ribonuclease P protein component
VGPIRSRRTFEELRQSRNRGRSGPLGISFVVKPSWSEAKVAYAVNRRVGNAVKRNRLKRRLRAIVSEQAAHLPAGAYLVHAGPGGPLLGFDQLKVAMSQALEKATTASSRRTSAERAPQREGGR